MALGRTGFGHINLPIQRHDCGLTRVDLLRRGFPFEKVGRALLEFSTLRGVRQRGHSNSGSDWHIQGAVSLVVQARMEPQARFDQLATRLSPQLVYELLAGEI